GKSAELIINEVVGTLTSNLQGLLEVVGQKASVFIANPNGITCNGCGFVNTPAVTLSTGKPVFDKDGALAALAVKKGTITIGEKGLDATAQDDVDIISRAAILNGKVQAKNLTLTQGANQVDFKHGTVVPIAGEGDSPWKAIDTGSLGGMYANKIRLVSTEVGKEVNLANLTATQGDISLTADGELSLANALIKRAKNIFLASKGEIEISLSPYLAKFNDNQSNTDSDVLNDDAQRELISQRLRQFSQLEADENIEIHAGAGVNLRGISLTAGKDITLTSGNSLDVGKVITANNKDTETTKLTAKQGGISLTANGRAALGDVQAKTDITVNGKDIETTKLTAEQGSISLTASGKAALGDVQAKTDITVNGKDIETAKQSNMQAGQSLILTTETLRGQGEISVGSDVTVKASHLSFYGGKLKAGNQVLLQGEQNLTVRDTDISGHDITLISSGGGISVSSGENNSIVAGTRAFSIVSAANTLHILSEQGISLSNMLINRAKNIFLASKGEIEISLSPYLAKFNDNQSSTDSDVLNDDAQRELISQRLRQFSQLEADENIEIHAGAGVNLR
ncbi:hemagglutinin, partial [Photorhabdus luminescens]